MKKHFSVWLHVCLYSALSLGAVSGLSAASPAAANGAAGDVPVATRPADSLNHLNTSAVAKSDVQILERARAANDDVYSSLQSFVCNEQINRFKGSMNGQTAHPLDTVTAKLSFERGVEQYSNVQQNNHPRPGLSSLPGAWSEGEFGTLLLQTQQLLTTQQVDFDSFADVRGEQTALYHFDVAADDSPWDLTVAGHHYRLPFRTNVWISVNTGEILKIERATLSIASETRISEIQWGITLDHVAINGKTWLLPATGSYAVLYNESHHREWNQIAFTDYKRYGAETALKFE
jgi:hypothetical protein